MDVWWGSLTAMIFSRIRQYVRLLFLGMFVSWTVFSCLLPENADFVCDDLFFCTALTSWRFTAMLTVIHRLWFLECWKSQLWLFPWLQASWHWVWIWLSIEEDWASCLSECQSLSTYSSSEFGMSRSSFIVCSARWPSLFWRGKSYATPERVNWPYSRTFDCCERWRCWG